MRNRLSLWLSLALVALVVLVYSGVRGHGFVPIDDPAYVSNNPHVLGGLTLENVRWAFTTRWASYWIPLTWISYMADVQLFGPGPGVLHVTNVVFHIANTLLLFYWLRRSTGAPGPSALAAALFAAHPLHVESVAWITERKDVLSTLFLLLALIAYSTYVGSKTDTRKTDTRYRFSYAAVCACLVLGLLAKPMLVTVPFLLLLCDVWPLGRVRLNSTAGWGAVVLEKWPLFVIAAAAGAIVFVTQDRGGATITNSVFPLELRLANAAISYVIYLRQTIWPAGLLLNYPYPTSIPVWQVVGACALLGALTVAALRWATARPYLAVGWLWFVGTLVPVIGLVQVGIQPRADRFTYVPLIGLFMIVGWGVAEVSAHWRSLRTAVVAATVGLAIVYAAVARRQVEYWKDGVTLWSRSVAATPADRAAQAHFDLASALVLAKRDAEAIPHYEESLRRWPGFAGAHAGLGEAYQHEGRLTEARSEYELALRLDPGLPVIHNNLGAIYATANQLDDALRHFAAAVRLEPDLESAQVNLGVVLARLGRRDEAVGALTAALRLNPSNAQARRVLELLRKEQ